MLAGKAEWTYTLTMERGLALTLWGLISLEIVTIKLLSKSGVLDVRMEWHRYVADHTTLWLIFVPLFYAALCEVARADRSPKILLTLTRALGVVLLLVFAGVWGCVIFDI